MSINEKKLESLRKKFDMAEESINQMTAVVEDIDDSNELNALAEVEISEPGKNLPAISEFEEVFTLDLLKSDFTLMRSNLLSLITRGQQILEDTGAIDIVDMKASQLSALAELQLATGANIKLLIEIYKSIIGIEKEKYVLIRGLNQENLGSENANQIISNTTNNIVVGSTHDILQALEKANKPKEIEEIKE